MAPKEHFDLSMDQIVDFILRKAKDDQIIVGPLVWQPSDGTRPRIEYFMVATSSKKSGFRVDRVVVNHETDRATFLLGISAKARAKTVHITEDELYMAKLCEMLWPSERTTRLRKSVEAERGIG